MSWYKNGIEAFKGFGKNSFDICLLDVMMPELNGFDVIANLDPHRPQHGFVDRRVANYSSLADAPSTCLELRLHQQRRLPAGPEQRLHRGEHEPERDEGEVPGHEVHALAERLGPEQPRVLALPDDDARVPRSLGWSWP